MQNDKDYVKQLYELFDEYQDVFMEEHCKVGNTLRVPGTRGKTNHKESAPPSPPPHFKENLKKQVDDWVRDCVIEPFNSPWASPLVPA